MVKQIFRGSSNRGSEKTVGKRCIEHFIDIPYAHEGKQPGAWPPIMKKRLESGPHYGTDDWCHLMQYSIHVVECVNQQRYTAQWDHPKKVDVVLLPHPCWSSHCLILMFPISMCKLHPPWISVPSADRERWRLPWQGFAFLQMLAGMLPNLSVHFLYTEFEEEFVAFYRCDRIITSSIHIAPIINSRQQSCI